MSGCSIRTSQIPRARDPDLLARRAQVDGRALPADRLYRFRGRRDDRRGDASFASISRASIGGSAPSTRRRKLCAQLAERKSTRLERTCSWRISGLHVPTRSRPALVIPRVSGCSTAGRRDDPARGIAGARRRQPESRTGSSAWCESRGRARVVTGLTGWRLVLFGGWAPGRSWWR